jgi:hypothetical protein
MISDATMLKNERKNNEDLVPVSRDEEIENNIKDVQS